MRPDAAGPDAATRTARPPWTLQRRLIVTVVSIVSLILVLVAVAMNTILGGVLEGRLNEELKAVSARTAIWVTPQLNSGRTAAELLETGGPLSFGTLLAVETQPGEPTAAVLDESGRVVELDVDQIDAIAQSLGQEGPLVVSIDDLGTYRIEGFRVGSAGVVVGVSRSDVATTIGQMLTTIALLTLGGLLLLGVATAWTIRAGLAPLRAVAATAERVSRIPLDQGAVTIAERVPAAEADPRTEVGRVGASLNTLLDHVATSLDSRQRNEERMRAFVADASHELRTPLASIRGYSELSLRALGPSAGHASGPASSTDLTDTTRASLERIQAQSLRMSALVEDLLLLARLDEGQDLVYGAVDLSRLAVEGIGDAQAAGPEHRWMLDLADEPVVVAGDAGRLSQVLGNLLANARIHTPDGTTVTLTVAREGEDAVVRVHDDGPGIDREIADELFERFSRADRSRARKTGGTGLGLSIARAIATAHGGSLEVRSTPGDTTFELRLPTARPAVRPTEPDQ